MRSASVEEVATPAYLARHGTPQTPDDLKAHLAVRASYPHLQWNYVFGTL
jgi:hypothetical protein